MARLPIDEDRMRLRFLGLAFVLTGAGALVIEQAFEKLLTTVVGASVDAGAIVLGVYFLGMSIGAASFHRLRAKVSNGATLYAGLEASIGIWALMLGAGFSLIQSGSAAAIQMAGSSPTALFVARTLVAACWIAPPTFAMGASFPAVVSWLKSQGGDVEKRASGFYTLNIVGALIGSTGAAYILFPSIGLQASLIAVGVIELVVAAAVMSATRSEVNDAEPASRVSIPAVFSTPEARRPLFAAFMSGMIVFSFEVLWLHLGGVTIGMSAYSFAGVLTMVLLGLFVGGSIASSLRIEPTRSLPIMFVLATLALVAVYPMWDDIPGRFPDFQGIEGFWQGEAVRLLLLSSVVGIPAFALGLVYPSVLRLPVPGVPRDALVAGLGLANGFGSIVGALLVGFLCIETFGSEGTYRGLIAIMVVAIAVSVPVRAGAPALVAVLALNGVMANYDLWDRLALTSGTNVYFSNAFITKESKLVFWHEDNSGGITTVGQGPSGDLTLLTNGKFQGNDTGEMIDQAGIAMVPVGLTAERGRALVVGLGTGQSAHVIASAGFKSVDVAEIARGMVEAAALFRHANGDVLNQENVTLKVGDGRNILMREEGKYDLISLEISSVWFAGAANLYSRDFYELASSRLAPRGVFQQWMQLHHLGSTEMVSTLATVRAVFPYVSLWVVGSQGIIIGSNEPVDFDVARLDGDGLAMTRELLEKGGYDLKSTPNKKVLDEAAMDKLYAYAQSEGVRLNTDSNRYLEFSSPRYNLVRGDLLVVNLRWLYDFVGSPELKARILQTKRSIYGQ